MRLEGYSRIGGTSKRLLHYGPVARENPGKIWEINGTGQDFSLPLAKVSRSTKLGDFSWKTSISITNCSYFSCVPFITQDPTSWDKPTHISLPPSSPYPLPTLLTSNNFVSSGRYDTKRASFLVVSFGYD